jgi:hypothetical protein
VRVALVEPSELASAIWGNALKHPAHSAGYRRLAERVVAA